MSDRPTKGWRTLIPLVMVLAASRVPGQVAPRLLNVGDQIAVFTDALRATAAMQEYYGLPGRLLLIPVTEAPEGSPAEPQRSWFLVALDTAVSGALLRSGAIAGLCLPGRDLRHCANDERGIGVRLSAFGAQWLDSTRVNIHVELTVVRSDRDYGMLVDSPPRHDFWSFKRLNGHWKLSMPALRP